MKIVLTLSSLMVAGLVEVELTQEEIGMGRRTHLAMQMGDIFEMEGRLGQIPVQRWEASVMAMLAPKKRASTRRKWAIINSLTRQNGMLIDNL